VSRPLELDSGAKPKKILSSFVSIARRTADMTDSLVYRKFKLPLDPSRLTDPKALARLRTAVHHAADITGVALADPVWREHTRSRSVIFYDTDEFDLYRNSFILRKRTRLSRGHSAHQEMVFKFRHPDRLMALRIDPRPAAEIPHILRFKEQVLPLGPNERGMRSIFWHGCKIFEPCNLQELPYGRLAAVFPPLRHLRVDPDARLKSVNGVIVDESLSEIGKLEFAERVTARAFCSFWSLKPGHRALAGELSFQIKYDLGKISNERIDGQSESLYLELQSRLAEWTIPGGTKVRELYRLYTDKKETGAGCIRQPGQAAEDAAIFSTDGAAHGPT
jgi:hypothetical protein